MRKSVLFVDDVSDWRKMLSGLLEDNGYAVTAVGGIDEAQQALAGEIFDLAIIDVRLDETDESNTEGLTLAKSVKGNHPSLPIIILTGYGTMKTAELAMKPDQETGQRLAAAFVGKDEMNALPQIVENVLASKTRA